MLRLKIFLAISWKGMNKDILATLPPDIEWTAKRL
jgi:hypothetical protein